MRSNYARIVIRLLLIAGLFCTLPGGGFAQGVFHNQRLFVVPAPGPVTIDGKLDDWDLSGEILPMWWNRRWAIRVRRQR